MHPPHALAGLVLLLALAACDSFGEPERFVNEEARPPVVGALDVADLRPGQHVAGDVPFVLDLDSLAGRIDRVTVTLDGEEVAFSRTPPFAFTLRTERYAQGAHELAVVVHETRPRAGLLNVADAPAVYLSVPVVFDQRPPTPVRGLTAELEGLRPRLRWEESADANFYAYVVYRRPSYVAGYEAWPGEEVATIYDRSQTTYLDAAVPEIYGGGGTYRVAVSNRREEALPEQPATATFGTLYPDLADPAGAPVASPDGSELYFVSGIQLVAVSAASRRRVRELDLPELEGDSYPRPRSDLHLDNAGRLLVSAGVGASFTLRVVDSATFAVEQTYELPYGARRFALRDGRLYTVGTVGATQHLFVLDAATGAVLGTGPATDWYPSAEVAAVSPDGASVYVMDYRASRVILARVDLSGERPRIAAERALGYSSEWALAVAPDGRVFAHSGMTVAALDGATLRPLGAEFAPGGTSNYRSPKALRVGRGRLYVSYGGTDVPSLGGGEVAELDLGSLARVRSWTFADDPVGLALGRDGDLLVFGRAGAWSVPL